MRNLCIVICIGTLLPAFVCRAQVLSPPDQKVLVGRLPCAGGGDPRTHGLRQLMWELMKRTSAEAELESLEVDPASPSLFRTPLLLWACDGPVASLDKKARTNLQRFLVLGGVLLVDDPAAAHDSAFDRSVREELAALFPEKQPRDVPSDHVLYKTFFLVDRPVGRVVTGPLQAIDVGGRLAVIVSPNDLLGAASKDLYGNWESLCEPGGEHQREMAIRLGINIVYYSLCLDYKDDRVHLPFILRRRKL